MSKTELANLLGIDSGYNKTVTDLDIDDEVEISKMYVHYHRLWKADQKLQEARATLNLVCNTLRKIPTIRKYLEDESTGNS